LLIWHIDETRGEPGSLDPQGDETHKLVDLEEAGGFQNLDLRMGAEGWSEGSDDDPFPGRTGNREFGDTTTPDANTYSGADSSVVIYQISDSASVMTALVGIGDPPQQPTFPDVSASHPYFTAISGMAARDIIVGYPDGDFGPADLVIRQQFAKMIVKTLGLTVTGYEVSPFVDVLPGTDADPFYPLKYVAVCAHNSITKGVDATHFNPYANISRQQVITMVVRAADKVATGTLAKVPADWGGQLSYADPTHGLNVKKAEYNGLLAGIRASLATPGLAGWNTGGNATRGEVAQILWNLLAKMGD
jgi:hypothetical protein